MPKDVGPEMEPREAGDVCSVCRRLIVPNEDAHHGMYGGVEARHYECSGAGRVGDARKALRELREKAVQLEGDFRRFSAVLERGGRPRSGRPTCDDDFLNEIVNK